MYFPLGRMNATIIDPDGDGYTGILTAPALSVPCVIPAGLQADRLYIEGHILFAVDTVSFIHLKPNGADTNCTGSTTQSNGSFHAFYQEFAFLPAMVCSIAGRVEVKFTCTMDFKTGRGNRMICDGRTIVSNASGATKDTEVWGGQYSDSTTAITSLPAVSTANLATGSWLKIWAVKD